MLKNFRRYNTGFEGMLKFSTVFKNQRFVFSKKNRGLLPEGVIIVVLSSVSLDSLKILKRYVDIFKKQLSLTSFYFFNLTSNKNFKRILH